jgi:hypothetical protein
MSVPGMMNTTPLIIFWKLWKGSSRPPVSIPRFLGNYVDGGAGVKFEILRLKVIRTEAGIESEVDPDVNFLKTRQ